MERTDEERRGTDHLKWLQLRKLQREKRRGGKTRAVELRLDYRVSVVPAAQSPAGSDPSLNLNLNPAPSPGYFRLLWKH